MRGVDVKRKTENCLAVIAEDKRKKANKIKFKVEFMQKPIKDITKISIIN